MMTPQLLMAIVCIHVQDAPHKIRWPAVGIFFVDAEGDAANTAIKEQDRFKAIKASKSAAKQPAAKAKKFARADNATASNSAAGPSEPPSSKRQCTSLYKR
jgi:hypothetical protein